MTGTRCPHCGEALNRRELAELLLAAYRDTRPEPSEDDLLDRVRAYVAENPPATKRAVRAGVTGANPSIDAALAALTAAGEIARWGDGYRVADSPETDRVAGRPDVREAHRAPARSPYVGGPCPDEDRCDYWHRFENGPWTCEACHPRVPESQSQVEGQAR